MADIGPGDFVEALSDCESMSGCIAVTKGSVYRVDRLGLVVECSGCGDNGAAINLVGDAPQARGGWCPVCEMRPVYRPRADLIETLLAPAPELEPA